MSETPFQAPSPEHLAELLPQFDIESFIAQGGMGAVFKGRQRSLDRAVAIKVLPKELGANEEFRESFNKEAKAMARLNHPNLLGVFDFGNVDGMPYIVMEYVEGGSLHEACINKVVDPAQAVAIVRGICDGLAKAHEQDIVHRDIKPANILLTEKLEAKVADFGLAHAIDSDQPGLVMGTPGYTAPEVFRDPNQAGKLADIYSVGVILHQLLSGIDPSGSMEPPTKATLHPRLDAIWRKATHSVPAMRYGSVDAMAKDLEKWDTSSKPQAASIPASPHRPTSRPVKVTAAKKSGGAGPKILLVGVLVVASIFAYQFLIKGTGDTGEKNADVQPIPEDEVVDISKNPDAGKGKNHPPPDIAKKDPAPIETVRPDPVPVPNPPEVAVVDPKDDGPAEEPELEPGDPELRKKAVDLILNARAKRNSDLAENARWFVFQLGIHGRTAKSDENEVLGLLKEKTSETRIPVTNAERVPISTKADFELASGKEKAIDSEYESSLKQIRDAYVKRLGDAAKGAAEEGLKKKLLAQAGRAEDLQAWVKLLAPGDENPLGQIASLDGMPDAASRVSSGPVEIGGPGTWFGKATVLAWTALPEDFLRFRTDVLEKAKGTQDARTANFAAKVACICVIDDKGVQTDVLKLAQLAFEKGQGDDQGSRSFRSMLLGIAQYRCGEFAKARVTLETVDLEWPPVALATDYFEVLCMVREGGNANLTKARALFGETEKKMPAVPSDDEAAKQAPERLLMWLAYKEAKAVL